MHIFQLAVGRELCSERCLVALMFHIGERGDNDVALDRRKGHKLVLKSEARCAERDSSQGMHAAWLFGYAAMAIIEY